MTAIVDLLTRYREGSKTEREKGTYFERLCAEFLKSDPEMAQQYEDVWLYSEWAEAQNLNAKDTGIDVVAKLRDEEGYCAVQCKFYQSGHRIRKSDIDSFFTASGKKHFKRRLIIDTTDAPWSTNAEDALKEQSIETTRIGLDRLNDSPINWATFLSQDRVVLAPKKEPLDHQRDALKAVQDGLTAADRGKVIMACGTGKTFTALQIAEALAGEGGYVLYLVPSLSLMSQSVREWSIDTKLDLRSFAVCSDAQVGKRNTGKDDIGDIDVHDLAHPATTNPAKLGSKAGTDAPDRMTVVFATYQSIQVISDAQKLHGLPEFDLIICDEAHRTTGATLAGEDESNFVKVHKQDFIAGKKRIYMTATPRIFGDAVKTKAGEVDAELSSMDDVSLYGETLFQRGFGWAVQKGLLTDYKVIVLVVDEAMVSTSIQSRLTDENSELKLDDATKIIGCYKALTKADLAADVATDTGHMRRALAFCKDIASSKLIRDEFGAVVDEYLASVVDEEEAERQLLHCELRHVDGTFGAKARTRELEWLKAEDEAHAARILTNARCLSEGVDVPALDAIMFMHPRKSQIDVVQSVGRVMRRAPGKKMGYVILPVGVPAGMAPEEALNNNEKYKVVWQILNALRAHDERFDATINKMELGVDVSGQIEVIAVSNKLPVKKEKGGSRTNIGQGGGSDEGDREGDAKRDQALSQAAFAFDEFSTAIMAKIVKKCGKRDYWEDWAGDIAKIAQTHITRITAVVQQPESKERNAFENFLAEIRDDLNESISEAEAIEMLAQHIITKPVFEALFEGYSFTQNNPVSVAMQSVLDVLDEQSLEKEAESLQKFYASVKVRAAGIDNAAGKQRIIVELYDKFFRNAFPRMTEKLGIVYTPVEVVDFIIHSVNDVLKAEFGQTLGSDGVHILDPFTGTGTFITRLLQSGIITSEQLERKYVKEIHANEIVLLAYYIAAINIEAVYHSLSGGDYKPFEGICLTDTFQLYEKDDLVSGLLADNSSRRQKQKALDIRVVIGNPPYSEGQETGNDNAQNVPYPSLDQRIRETFGDSSRSGLQNSLFNSYIRAIRWASDRVGARGVVGFVTSAGWLRGNSLDGLRKCLVDEFADLYIFDLRGNARTKGEMRRKERENVFGEGTRAPVAISILVKRADRDGGSGRILYRDIGDYLTKEEKLAAIGAASSVGQMSKHHLWEEIVPDNHGDWFQKRDSGFSKFLPVASKGAVEPSRIFHECSSGLKTNRDAWCVNFSRRAVATNMSRLINHYNAECSRYADAHPRKGDRPDPETFVNTDPLQIKWTRELFAAVRSGREGEFSEQNIVLSAYRPFTKQWCYYDRQFNNCVYQLPKIFPHAGAANRMIMFSGPGSHTFSALMVDCLPSYDFESKGVGLPLWLYDSNAESGLFECASETARRSGISDATFRTFTDAYVDEEIAQEDVFYYVYGVLHAQDYREQFSNNLAKELPRIPRVKSADVFRAYSQAGRALADLHLSYETADPYPVTFKEGALFAKELSASDYRVEKMRFGGKGKDKSIVIYNPRITMTDIPLEAYDYVVNGKPALEWVMEFQGVWIDRFNPEKKRGSDIKNDANRYAVETVGDPAYPLKLFQRVITVSLETMKIVRSLPALDI